MADPAASKQQLRQRLRRRVAGLDREQRRDAAGRAAARFLSLPEVAPARRVLTCLSFGDEIDTWRLTDRLLASGREVYVPRVAGDELTVHRFPCDLETLSFGLRQPRPEVPALTEDAVDATLDVALILGLGFDRGGYRLGHGRGYFDRFLAGRRLATIGFAYSLQLVDRLPRESHDVPMVAIATDTGIERP